MKTLVASGRTKRIRGNNLVPIEFELFLELPDKYLRADEFPAEDTDPTSSGFNGDALIQIPPLTSGPMPGGPMGRPGGMAPGGMPPGAPPPAGATPPPAAAPPSGTTPPGGVPPGAAAPGPGGPPAGGRGPAMDGAARV